MATNPRKYVPSKKHKWPKGFGETCPLGLSTEDAQVMLDRAVPIPPVREKALWSVDGTWLFMAYPGEPHSPERNHWHGFPVVGGKADVRVLYQLRESGLIDDTQFRVLCRQKKLPSEWPA
ncbi:MAG: hypothetical protein R3F65_04670 [bacterium]|nr:hypothetical protein [Myxococcales bacterium]